jgi:hypothetical protein
MPRFFNTTGPCDPARHDDLPATRSGCRLWVREAQADGNRVAVL